MSVTLLEDVPLAPRRDLGRYRVADYLRLPDEPRYELIYGRFYMSPSPLAIHQVIVTLLWRLLDEVAQLQGGVAMVAPLDVHLADHSVVQPDVVYLGADRLHLVTDWVRGAPTLVIEVLSPGTARRDRSEKLRIYAETGVGEYWIVDVAEKQIEFLINEEGRFVVALPDGRRYRSTRVGGLEFDLEDFWRQVAERVDRLPASDAPA